MNGTGAGSAAERVRLATEALREPALVAIREDLAVLEEIVLELVEGRAGTASHERAHRAAHRILGTAGTFGFHRASEVAGRLQKTFERPVDASGALPAAALVEELHRALAEHSGSPATPRGESPAQEGGPVERNAVGAELPAVLLATASHTLSARVARNLSARGVEVQTADGSGGGRVLGTGQVPAAALVDLASGVTADLPLLRELRKRRVPTLALVSAQMDTAGRLAALEDGATLLLDAPPHTDSGAARVAEALAGLLQMTSSAAHRVLVVDDDETLLRLVREILLATTAAEVVTLSDPSQFWAELSRVKPHLLILDIDMPDIDGLELCRVVRSEARWHHLPVVFLSGRSGSAIVRQVFEAGADDFVSKPVLPAELQARVGNRLERSRLLTQIAERDPVTGLANWRGFEREVARLQDRARAYGASLSVGLVEVCGFRDWRERRGHASGELLLRRMATLLRGAFHGHDVVARLEGEQFAVAMLGMRRQDGVERLAAVLQRFRPTDDSVTQTDALVRGCAGVAELGVDGSELDELLHAAQVGLRLARSGTGDPAVDDAPDVARAGDT